MPLQLPKTSLAPRSPPGGVPLLSRLLAVTTVAVLLLWAGQALAAGRLQEFLPKARPAEVFPGADRIGPPDGDPPLAAAYAGDRLLGHVYLN